MGLQNGSGSLTTTASMAPRAGNKRRTRRRRRLSLSSESSSGDSSGSESSSGSSQSQQEVQASTSKLEEAEESDSGDSSSSLGLDSSSEEEEQAQPTKQKNTNSALPDKTVQLQSKPAQNRPRSPSPPLFGFPHLDSSGKTLPPLLQGHVPGDNAADTSSSDPNHQELRDFYLEHVVNRFGKQLDDLKQEPGVADRLDLLINSLSQGAELLSTATAQDPNSIWQTANKSTGEKDVLQESVSKNSQRRSEPNGTSNHAGSPGEEEEQGSDDSMGEA